MNVDKDMRKYELTGETMDFQGQILHRIRAVRSFRCSYTYVEPGTVGGWLARPLEPGDDAGSLSHDGNCWVANNAKVLDQATVRGNAMLKHNAVMRDRSTISDNARVYDNAVLRDNACAQDSARVYSSVVVYGCTTIGGGAILDGNARVGGSSMLGGFVDVSNDAVLENVTLFNGQFREGARVRKTTDMLVIQGLMREGVVTLYRTEDEHHHRVTAGCQTFTLDDDLEELARYHEWSLPDSWRDLRIVLTAMVGADWK